MEETVAVQTENNGGRAPKTKFGAFLDRYFHISERGSTIVRELIGGLVIFLAMFYILPLNSNMLSGDWASIPELIGGQQTSNVRVTVDGIRQILLYGDVWASVDEVRAGIFAATAISASTRRIFLMISFLWSFS